MAQRYQLERVHGHVKESRVNQLSTPHLATQNHKQRLVQGLSGPGIQEGRRGGVSAQGGLLAAVKGRTCGRCHDFIVCVWGGGDVSTPADVAAGRIPLLV